MKTYVTALYFLGMIYTAKGTNIDSQLRFDCRRDQTNPCNGAICNSQTGQCLCGNVGKGVDCLISNSLQVDVTNPCSCANGGTCYTDTFRTQLVCDCTAAWRGPTCAVCRVDLRCTSTVMESNIYPQYADGFLVVLDILDTNGNPILNCRQRSDIRVATGPGFREPNFFVSLSVSSAVPDRCTGGRYVPPGTRNICYNVQLRYTFATAIGTESDETITLCCTGDLNPGGVTIAIGNQVSTLTVRDRVQLATGQFQHTSGVQANQVVTGPVSVGAKISFAINLTPQASGFFQDFRAISCWFTTPLGSNMSIIVDSCPVTNMVSIYRNLRKEFGTIYVDISAFDFVISRDVIMSCYVEGCIAPCALTQCPSSTSQNIGRKRRQIDEREESNNQVSAKFTIKITEDGPMKCPEQRSCDFHDAFLPVVIVFGVLLVVAILAGVLLCVKMNKRENRATTDITKAYFNPAVDKA